MPFNSLRNEENPKEYKDAKDNVFVRLITKDKLTRDKNKKIDPADYLWNRLMIDHISESSKEVYSESPSQILRVSNKKPVPKPLSPIEKLEMLRGLGFNSKEISEIIELKDGITITDTKFDDFIEFSDLIFPRWTIISGCSFAKSVHFLGCYFEWDAFFSKNEFASDVGMMGC